GLNAALAEVWQARAASFMALAGTVNTEWRPGRVDLFAGMTSDLLPSAFARITARLLETDISEAEATIALARVERRYLAERWNEATLACAVVRGELFSGSPEAQPAGRPRDLAQMTAADLSTFFRHNLTRSQLRIRLTGRVPDDFSWQPPRLSRAARGRRSPPPPRGQKIIIVDKPGTNRAVVGLGQWPVVDMQIPCGQRLFARELGYRRGFWWMHRHPDAVERAVMELLALSSSRFAPTEGCAADQRAAELPLRSSARDNSEPPRTSVIVVVTGQTAGLAAALSKRTGITNVSVVPYDRD
ncbi:MAG: hypothetical protein AAF449_18410, partial [Myxococcota bacterium]